MQRGLIINNPDNLGYLVEKIAIAPEDLYEVPDEDFAEGYISGSGAILSKRNDDDPNAYRLKNAKLARLGDYPILTGSLFSFKYNQIKYKALKNKYTNRYLGYYNAQRIEGLSSRVTF